MEDTIIINGLTFEKYLKAEVIAERVKELALAIQKDIDVDEWTFVVLLNGAYLFAGDLLRQFRKDVEVRFVKLSSYHDMESSGSVLFDKRSAGQVDGKKIFLIEDIVDTGKTLEVFTSFLREQGVAEIKLCSLLEKPSNLQYKVVTDYLGFSIPDLFVVGYGLDYNDRGRGLKDIYILQKS